MRAQQPLAFAFVVVVLAACGPSAEEKKKADDAAAAATAAATQTAVATALATQKKNDDTTKALAKIAATTDVTDNPEKYLKITVEPEDKGLLSHTRSLVALTLTNESKFAVVDLRGDVNMMDAGGSSFGSVPVTLSGSVAPGETKKFSVKAGTMTSGGVKVKPSPAGGTYKMKWSHVGLVDVK